MLDAHCSHFSYSDIAWPKQPIRIEMPNQTRLLKIHWYKQVSGDPANVSFFLSLFPGKPAVLAVVTLACSPMMRGDKVLKLQLTQPKYEAFLPNCRQVVRFGQYSVGLWGNAGGRRRFQYNGLVAGHPGDSNKTLSCRVNERWSLC